jgi:hypothetical protein
MSFHILFYSSIINNYYVLKSIIILNFQLNENYWSHYFFWIVYLLLFLHSFNTDKNYETVKTVCL